MNDVYQIIESDMSPNVKSRRLRPLLQETYKDSVPWARCVTEAIYCLTHGIQEQPVCGYEGCTNTRHFSKQSSSYTAGCCGAHAHKNTMLGRYGVDSPVKVQGVLEKMQETCVQKYGVTHAAKADKFKAKAKETCLTRYGHESYSQTKEYAEHIKVNTFNRWVAQLEGRYTPLFNIDVYENCHTEYKWSCCKCGHEFVDKKSTSARSEPSCPKCYPKNTSVAEKDIADFCESLGLEVILRSRSVIPPFELDIWLPEISTAIEYHGLYWHQNKSHVEKTNMCDAAGITLLQFFEDEWENKSDIIRSMISAKCGKLGQSIHARSCDISLSVPSAHVQEFLKHNHMQGACKSSVNVCLLMDGEIVAVAAFGVSRFNKNVDWELLRFAVKLGTRIPGAFSKCIKHFVAAHGGSIISYADRRYSSGNVYKVNGFALSHITPPGYSYYRPEDGSVRQNRQHFQKHKLAAKLKTFDTNKTEALNMADNGFSKIWDCGQMVWVLETRSCATVN